MNWVLRKKTLALRLSVYTQSSLADRNRKAACTKIEKKDYKARVRECIYSYTQSAVEISKGRLWCVLLIEQHVQHTMFFVDTPQYLHNILAMWKQNRTPF